jgi:hypothetical protein
MRDAAAGSQRRHDGEPMTPGRIAGKDGTMAHAARSIGAARLAFVSAAWLFVVSVVIQTVLVGLDIFADLGGSIHRDFAYIYGWLAPILVLLASLAHVPARLRNLSIVLLVVFAVQTVLPSLKDDYPLLASLHTVNALVILGLGLHLARRATDWVSDLSRTEPADT